MRARLAVLGAIVLVLLVMPLAWRTGSGSSPEVRAVEEVRAAAPVPSAPPAAPAAASSHAHHSAAVSLDASPRPIGVVVPRQTVDVVANVAGVLRACTAVEGASVDAGASLCDVEPRLETLRDVQLAAASVAVAKMEAARADVQAGRAQTEARRAKDLFKEGLISATDRDRALADEQLATLQVSLSRETVHEKTVSLEFAKRIAADAAIVAPIAGRVAKQFVQPGAALTPGTKVLRLIDSSSLRVRVAIDAGHHAVRLGAKVHLMTAEGGHLPGVVVSVTPEQDPATGLTVAEIAPETPFPPGTRIGSSVDVHIP